MELLLGVAKCRQRVGRGILIGTLRASHSVRVFSRRLYLQSTFGLLREHSEEELDRMITALIEEGLLEETADEYPRLLLTDAGRQMLAAHEDELEAALYETEQTE